MASPKDRSLLSVRFFGRICAVTVSIMLHDAVKGANALAIGLADQETPKAKEAESMRGVNGRRNDKPHIFSPPNHRGKVMSRIKSSQSNNVLGNYGYNPWSK